MASFVLRRTIPMAASVARRSYPLRFDGELMLTAGRHRVTMRASGNRVVVGVPSFTTLKRATALQRAFSLPPRHWRLLGVLLELHVRGHRVASSDPRGVSIRFNGWRLYPMAMLRALLAKADANADSER